MSTYSWMSAPDITSDTAFRKWVQGIHDAFAACGWMQTTDTGQLVISTATVPSVANTAAGYEIWRLDDAMQSAAPVFLKIEYGKYTAANSPTVWITVGQSTNGAGTIGTVLFARTGNSADSAGGSTSEFPSYASGDGSSLCLALWPAYTGARSAFIAIERSRDATGSATADALVIAMSNSVAANGSVCVIGNGGTPGAVRHALSPMLPVSFPSTINGQAGSVASSLSKDGTVAPVLPIPLLAPGVTPWVSNVIVAVHPGDAGATSVIQAATINGATRTYRAWPAFAPNSGLIPLTIGTSPTRCLPAILWED